MGGLIAFLYGAVAYVIFFVTFLYAIGFLGNFFVPKTIDSGTPGGLVDSIVVNTLLLTVFALQHSVMARPGFKAQWTRLVPKSVERSTYVLISSLLLILLFWQWRPMPAVVWSTEGLAAQGILAIYAAGWTLVLLSTFWISHFDLFGLSQVFARLRKVDLPKYSFVAPAMYKIVRHPMMLGWIVLFWAAPVMTLGHLLFAAATTAYIMIAIPIEERDLVKYLGQEYVDYQDSVPALVPFSKSKEDKAGNTGNA